MYWQKKKTKAAYLVDDNTTELPKSLLQETEYSKFEICNSGASITEG